MFPALPPVASWDGKPLLGFSSVSSSAQSALEQRIDALIQPSDQDAWMQKLTARPHHVGSAYGAENARYLLALYKAWGYDAQIETYDVLFPTPVERLIEMNGWKASLNEPSIAEDPGTKPSTEALPLYNAYSRDGDVTAPLVYANFGTESDYDSLEEHGIDVKGKIVIVRYGGGWRGAKPKIAAEHGAIGCIIYSDPKEDGYGRGDVYPKGPWRDSSSGQRGTVADVAIHPGDPLTPGSGSTPGTKRLSIADAATLTKIPVLPIGYGDATPLIQDLQGPSVPEAWRGGLPFSYHMGPSAHPVHLKAKFDWKNAEVRDVIAKLPGSELPGQWVIRGNHHDAWVYGASDPVSGQVAMLSEAKALGDLAKEGWRPKRTIVFCSWDGEEQGLLGSTEWTEAHAQELTEKAVAYINSDANGRGLVKVSGSHSLQPFVNQVLRDVTDPDSKRSVLDRARADCVLGAQPEFRDQMRTGDLPIGPLGMGSDYSPFIDHLGIPSIDFGYGDEEAGQYHSSYDSYRWFTKFGDPNFSYGKAAASTGARLLTRLADADELPFDYGALAKTVNYYVSELVALIKTMRQETVDRNRLVQDGVYLLASYPATNFKAPKLLDPVPPVDLSALQNSAKRLLTVTEKCRGNFPTSEVAMQAERALLGPGLPGRPWYRHSIYGPGSACGYGAKPLPGVRECVERRQWTQAVEQAGLVAEALDRLSRLLESSSGMNQRSAF